MELCFSGINEGFGGEKKGLGNLLFGGDDAEKVKAGLCLPAQPLGTVPVALPHFGAQP